MFGKMKVLTVALGVGMLATAANAEKYNWGNVRFDGGGFVSAVIFHPKAENLLYARTDVGGIYRFDFAKKTWPAPQCDRPDSRTRKERTPLC